MTQTQGYTLTDIPGLERIVVEPDPASARGVHVMLVLPGAESVLDYGVTEIEQLSSAIEHACSLAGALVHEIDVNSRHGS